MNAGGADAQAENSIYHDVPVQFASWSGQPDVLELSLSRGADVNQINPETGWTALHYASMEDEAAAIEGLMAKSADPALRDSKGKTPLQVAKSAATAELLRKLGATE
jgi:ankyrin repeat protein